MCCCSDYVCDVVHEERRTSRKHRHCQECGVDIEPGDKYLHVSTLFDGNWDHMAFCALCDARMTEWKDKRAGFFCFTELRDWRCNVDCRPPTGGALARLTRHDPRELELRRECREWGTRMGLLVKWIFEDAERVTTEEQAA